MPRVPELDAKFREAFMPRQADQYYLFGRFWQLSNTRYIIGQKEFLQELNRGFDPQQRFRVANTFDFVAKPGAAGGGTWELTPEGRLAIFEFTGALPRYRLYSQWQKTDENAALGMLTSPVFDPNEKVLVHEDVPAAAGSTNAGTATLVSYAPKKIEVKTETTAPSILLWNDRWSPNWHAFVDGQEVKLLRANYIMRGIQVPAGSHRPPATSRAGRRPCTAARFCARSTWRRWSIRRRRTRSSRRSRTGMARRWSTSMACGRSATPVATCVTTGPGCSTRSSSSPARPRRPERSPTATAACPRSWSR
jgi:hypothetical protein